MRRSQRLVLLLCLAVLTSLVPVSRGHRVEGSNVLPTPPRPPEQPAGGPGGAAFAFEGVSATRIGRPPEGFWLFEPTTLRLGEDPAAAGPLPVVIFFHGFTALDPQVYRGWIDHIVQRGAIVVYPDYQESLPLRPAWDTFLPNALQAVRAALAELASGGRTPPDLSRVAVVGHSLGGILAADFAAMAVAEGLPVPAALMPVEPGGCDGCGQLPGDDGVPLADLRTVAATTRALVVVGEDDDVVGETAAKLIWAGLSAVPLDRRDYVTLRSDHRGLPPLRATHLQPQTGGFGGVTDALDWYGTWKLFDALTSCAFAGEACEVALGDTAAQRFMGVWSDGEPVTEARVTDEP